MLVNLLHALRTLRDHKKVKSTSIIIPKIDNVRSDKVREKYISPESSLVPQFGKSIDKVRRSRLKNKLSKRSKGIHRKSKGTIMANNTISELHLLFIILSHAIVKKNDIYQIISEDDKLKRSTLYTRLLHPSINTDLHTQHISLTEKRNFRTNVSKLNDFGRIPRNAGKL